MSAMSKSRVLRIIKILSLRDHSQIPPPPSSLTRPRNETNLNRDYIGFDTGALPQNSSLQPVYENQWGNDLQTAGLQMAQSNPYGNMQPARAVPDYRARMSQSRDRLNRSSSKLDYATG